MSEDIDNTPVQDELEALKARADLLKIPYHPSIGVEKLRAKIAEALAEKPAEDPAPVAPVASDAPVTPVASAPAAAPVAPAVQAPAEPAKAPLDPVVAKRVKAKRDAMKMVRIRVTCMNPAKKEWEGEVFTVGNSLVPSYTKYIPFEAEDGWHVPHMMLEMLKARQCQVFTSVKLPGGGTVRKGKLIREFAIEVLEPLTEQELHDLAQRQAMAAGGGV